MIKILYCIASLCCTLCAAQNDQQPELSPFNLALNTFITGFDRHEGVVDNTLLLDFRRDDAPIYIENICDRLNQMGLIDMKKTEAVLRDISFKIIHSKKIILGEDQLNKKLSIIQILNFLPMFKDIQLIDSTAYNHMNAICFMNNVHYLSSVLSRKEKEFFYSSRDDLNNCRAFMWTNVENHDPSNAPLFEMY
ncbi:MAG: hypothetical protein NEHIOOID_00055 [Holosporales bacterium]